MTDLIVVPQTNQWQRLKALVLDSVSSPITKRVYNLGLDEFFAWFSQEPRPGFTKATVSAWRVALEARGLGSVSINVRITAVRMSDVCTLRKDAVSWDPEKNTSRVFLYTQKTGDPVFLPIPESLKLVLDALPLPRNAVQDCPCYFWNGQSSRRAVVGIAERTLAAVFKKSSVKDAHAHRYRHTFATRLLEQGATFEEVADILGNSPAVVRKHYGKWSKGRQANIDRLMMAHFQTAGFTNPVTRQSHEKTGPVN